jgi:hypothetical protein
MTNDDDNMITPAVVASPIRHQRRARRIGDLQEEVNDPRTRAYTDAHAPVSTSAKALLFVVRRQRATAVPALRRLYIERSRREFLRNSRTRSCWCDLMTRVRGVCEGGIVGQRISRRGSFVDSTVFRVRTCAGAARRCPWFAQRGPFSATATLISRFTATPLRAQVQRKRMAQKP